jgi:anti-anti-sigma factor
MSLYLDFTQEKHGAVIVEVVNLTRATMKEAEDFKEVILRDIELGWRKIVVDLTECEFIDSTFLGVLVISLKRITGLGGDLRLVGFQSPVESMFQLTRLARVFEAFKTKDLAIKSFISFEEVKEHLEIKEDTEIINSLFRDDTIIPLEVLKEESIRHALRVTRSNIEEAARKLQISKTSMIKMMEKYKIDFRLQE